MTFNSIAIIGGMGALGIGLARRLSKAGMPVMIGSRSPENARLTLLAECGIQVGTNRDAAAYGDVVIVTVPFSSQEAILREVASFVQGKIVVDTTVPLMPPKVARVSLPPEGSAAVRAQSLLGDKVRVVSAFHNVAAAKLSSDAYVDCDVLVFGDSREDRDIVAGMINRAGLRAVHGGSLANSAAAEALTSVLIFINKHYGADHAGLRITSGLFGRN